MRGRTWILVLALSCAALAGAAILAEVFVVSNLFATASTSASVQGPTELPAKPKGPWQPPVGIPVPAFGIEDQAQPANCFVDRTHSAASDENNPRGTEARPRATVPQQLGAGDVCEVRGTGYAVPTAPWALQGAAGKPAIVRGIGLPAFEGSEAQLSMTGQYFIVEGLKLVNTRLRMRADAHHAALRGLEITGWTGRRSTAMIGFETLQVGGSDVVIYRNHIHDNGPLRGSGDVHAFKVGGDTAVSRVWYVDNLVYRNAGDAVQVGSARSQEPWPRHIYIGRNHCYEDRENCVDIKQSSDVIVSENQMRGYRSTATSHGEAVVVHDGAERVWILNNTISDSAVGVVATRQRDDIVIAGNVISRILSDLGDSGRRSGSAVFLYGMSRGKVAWAVNNTITDSDAGLICAEENETCRFENNIVANMRKGATAIGFTDEPGRSAAQVDNNLLPSGAHYQIGRDRSRGLGNFKRDTGKCTRCSEADPGFVNPADSDFRLKSGSPAIDAGAKSAVYDRFQQIYSLNIARDRSGKPRPVRAWDLGAYESD